MKRSLGFAIAILVLSIPVVIFKSNIGEDHRMVPAPPRENLDGVLPEIEAEKSAVGTKENPQARSAYEMAMLVDPETGQLPENIRIKELRYSKKIPEILSKFRRGEKKEVEWRSIGPYNVGGRTRALAIDVSDENVILAGGVSGGMWRSEDQGQSWTKTTIPENIHSVSCIAQDRRPGKENIWYYGTGEFTSNSASKKNAPFRGDGVFKSTDGGKTWFQLTSTGEGVPNNYNSQFQYIWKVLPNPNELLSDEVFLAAVGAIFRSVDGGSTWNAVLGRKLGSTPDTDLNRTNISDFSDIVRTNDGFFYAVLSQRSRQGSSPDRGVYRSSNGVDWVRITPRIWPRNYARTVIATSDKNPAELFFSVNADEERLFKFTNHPNVGNGGVWEDLTENIPGFGGEVGDYDSQRSYNMVLEVHPDLGNVVYLGGTNLYRSDDGFSTSDHTEWIGGYDTANNVQTFPNHFVDQHALAFFPSDPNKMLSSNDGGVFITNDNIRKGISWIPLNNGFVTTQFYTLGLDEFGSYGDILGGLQDNGTLIANKPIDASHWNRILSGDGGYGAITKNASFHYASFQFGKIYRFTLDKNRQIQTFTRVDPNGSGGEEKLLFVNPFVLAPENQHIMYFAGGDVVWRNSNTSQIPLFNNYPSDVNWHKMSGTESPHGTISAICASYNPAGALIYGTATGELVKIEDANQLDYTVRDITSSRFPENAYVSSIAFDRKDSRNIAVSFSSYNVQSVFFSSDGGESFENVSGNLEENPDGSGSGPSVRWIEIVSKNNSENQLFAGTSTGIYSTSSLDGANTIWTPEGTESVGNVLVTMIRYFSEDGTIVAATHGNGMYESRLNDVWQTRTDRESEHFTLGNAFPNPFGELTRIPFTIPRDGMVRVRIYNSLGQYVKTLLWAEQYAGTNYISWDGTNEAGVPVLSGTYICRLEFEDQKTGIKLIFMR
ncbi:MAG: flagellar basal body rod modification protein [Cytophagales bacterium]|nr:flagellar basal body rod modification protein [Cytophagales bacterium]